MKAATILSSVATLILATSTLLGQWSDEALRMTPDPPLPYEVTRVYPHWQFDKPVECVTAPGTDRLFVAELDGRIYSFPVGGSQTKLKVFADFRQQIGHPILFYSVAFHPQYETNKLVYVSYALGRNLPAGSFLVEYRVGGDEQHPMIIPGSRRVLLNWRSGGHNGASLQFGNDGYLYMSTGDADRPNPPDPLLTGQDCSDLLSSILRIDVRSQENGAAYGIPKDNPFVGLSNVRPEIWAFGFRNPWKMSFDSKTGDLWVGDVGWDLWEMIYFVKRGGNYGWSVMEGRQPINVTLERGPAPHLSTDHRAFAC